MPNVVSQSVASVQNTINDQVFKTSDSSCQTHRRVELADSWNGGKDGL